MKVFWFVNGMLPEFSAALERPVGNTGGWMPSLVSAIRKFASNISLYILCEADEDYRAEVNGTHYFSFKTINQGPRWKRSGHAAFVKKLHALMNEIHPDVIHCHGTENGYLDFPAEVFGTIPICVSLQGIINGYYPHYMGGLTARQLKPYRNVLRNILTGHDLEFVADSWRKNVSLREVRCLEKAKCVMGRTDWDRSWAKVLAPNAVYHHVGEVLRPEFYSVERDERKVVPHSIVASAALKYPLKGGHWLLEAVSYLKKDYPDITVRFVDAKRVISPTSMVDKLRMTEYHKYIRQRIGELGLMGNVVLLSSLDAGGVVEQLKTAEVFCLPSLIENSPNSLGEAQLVGVPCVATDVGGNSSMVDNECTGLLVPSGDAASLACGIARLFEDHDLSRNMAKKAKAAALFRHAEDVIVGDLVNCYNEVSGYA